MLNRELVLEKGFLDKVEDNAAVRIWSKKTQQEKCNSSTEGYKSELWDFTRISLMSMWISTHSELWPGIGIPPITALLLERIQADKAYFRAANVPTFLNKLMSLMGMSEQRKRVDVFALSIYGLVILPKALGHIDDVVSNLLNRLDKRVIPVLAILAETFKSLSACRRACERRFIGDFDWVPLLEIWEAIGYTPIPVMQGLAQCEFAYRADNYKKKVREISNAWNQTHRRKRFATNLMTTPEYDWW
ncbi:hypothetical protein Golob_008192 [Gossypium lobatum]|uniref:Uncharacterized protein n=2 Tax=Gossypium lobatum TaxID=34289 RepID=A0A7J8MEQ5_9ROSI|nr:hypothetical protein [Gossypium lobatum]